MEIIIHVSIIHYPLSIINKKLFPTQIRVIEYDKM